jgi:hypothetical protein
MSVIASEKGRPRRFSTNQCGRGSDPVMVVSSGLSFETVSMWGSAPSVVLREIARSLSSPRRQSAATRRLHSRNARSAYPGTSPVASGEAPGRGRRGLGHRPLASRPVLR